MQILNHYTEHYTDRRLDRYLVDSEARAKFCMCISEVALAARSIPFEKRDSKSQKMLEGLCRSKELVRKDVISAMSVPLLMRNKGPLRRAK